MKFYAYVPEGYSDEILPESVIRYADDVKFFLHKIYERRVFDVRSKNDYVSLKAAYMRKMISERHYCNIKKTLLQLGLIESDDNYIKGRKSIGYRIGYKYRKCKHTKVEITNNRLLKKIQCVRQQMETNIELDVHQYLYKHLKTIAIDYDKAKKEEECLISVDMINDKDWFFTNDKYGRVHTNITNLKSNMRKYLRVDGTPLVELDIANSQPFFFSLILRSYILNNGRLGEFNFVNSLCKPILKHNKTFPPNPYSLRCDILHEDVRRYLDLVCSGGLYDYLFNMSNMKNIDKGKFKVKLFSEVFFCRNSWKTECTEIFSKEFPTVYQVIRRLKRKDFRALSRLLQKIESNFVINQVVRGCMEAGIFVTTIHDSILTKPCHEKLVRSLFHTVANSFGIVPTIRCKNYV